MKKRKLMLENSAKHQNRDTKSFSNQKLLMAINNSKQKYVCCSKLCDR